MTLREAIESNSAEPWKGFVILRSVERKVSKSAQPYYRIVLDDGTASIPANVFQDRAAFPYLHSQQWKAGDHMKVMGKVTLHQQYGKQMEILNIRPVEQQDVQDGYCPENLMETAPIDLNAAWDELKTFINKLEPRPLQRTVQRLFAQHGDKFRHSAAAKSAHHAYRGGLLLHTLMMLREAQALLSVRDFPSLNHSLIYAGILLHDLGKTEEIEPYPRAEYTLSGSLLGHVAIVLSWLDEAAAQENFCGDLLLHLKHIILSHHGQHEYGAAVLPKTAEAVFVNLIDNIDAKIHMIHRAVSQLPMESCGPTEKLWALDQRVFFRAPN